MSEQPLVSILIPTYQRAHSLLACLQSILSQTYEAIEIVIVDNASTDYTAELIQTLLADPRIRFFQNSSNLGAARNHNRCILESRGEYLKFLHSDDRFLDNKALEHWVEYMARYPTCQFVTCGAAYPSMNKELHLPIDLLRTAGFHSARQSLHIHDFGLPSDWMFRRSLLTHTGLLADSHICDCDFVMKAAYTTDTLTIAQVWIEHAIAQDNETIAANRLNGWEAMRLMQLAQFPYYSQLSTLQKAALSHYLHCCVLNRMLSAIWGERYSELLQGFSDLLHLDPALDLFPGEQRRRLLENLIRFIVQRRPASEIYEYLVNQRWSKPYAHHCLYGFSFSYELYHLADLLQGASHRLVLVGAHIDRAWLRQALPELEPYIAAELPELVLSDENPDGTDEQGMTLSDGTDIRRDRDVLLVGPYPLAATLMAQLTSNGWQQGIHFIPLRETR